MAKEKRLGRGLEALLNQVSQATQASDKIEAPQSASQHNTDSFDMPSTHSESASHSDSGSPSESVTGEQTDTVRYLDINLIDANPYQPRVDFDSEAINELAQSLNEHGLLQPTVVRTKDDGRYELVYGERRLRAALQVGWQQIPALIILATDSEMATLSLVENVQRRDLNAIEKARSIKRLLESEKCTQEVLAKRLCIDRSTVANLVRLLDLPADLQTAIREEKISAAHGRALLSLNDAQLQRDFTERIVNEHLSAHQVEDMVREFLHNDEEPGVVKLPPQKKKNSAQLAELEKEFYSAMGMKVKLSQGTGGKGKITIAFKSHEQFERLQNILLSGDYSDVVGKKKKAM